MHSGLIDTIGSRYTEQGFKRALITFGVVRGLNGVISVAQGTQVAFEPAGVGLTFAPGEILDPVNDLIERFSWIVLVSSTSLGVQRILLNITMAPAFTLLVSGFIVLAIGLLWWSQNPLPRAMKNLIYRMGLMLIILRVTIPLIAICGEGLYQYFLEPQYTQSQQQLERTAHSISELNQSARDQMRDTGDLGFLNNVKRAYESASNVINIDKRMDALKQAATDISEHAIQLMVVFLVQTIVFPLLCLWLVVQLLKGAFKFPLLHA